MKEFTCIGCPQGCHLTVDENNDYAVTGNSCKRGAEYGRTEATHPVRTVTTTVWIKGADIDKCPVKTSVPVPKEKMFEVMDAIKAVELTAPVRINDVVIKSVAGTNADVLIMKNVSAKR